MQQVAQRAYACIVDAVVALCFFPVLTDVERQLRPHGSPSEESAGDLLCRVSAHSGHRYARYREKLVVVDAKVSIGTSGIVRRWLAKVRSVFAACPADHQWLGRVAAVVFIVFDEAAGVARDLCVPIADLLAWQPAAPGTFPRLTYAHPDFNIPTGPPAAHPVWETVEPEVLEVDEDGDVEAVNLKDVCNLLYKSKSRQTTLKRKLEKAGKPVYEVEQDGSQPAKYAKLVDVKSVLRDKFPS
jgi:hypothetical protein